MSSRELLLLAGFFVAVSIPLFAQPAAMHGPVSDKYADQFSDLKALANRLQQAIDVGDIDKCSNLADEMEGRIFSLRIAIYTPARHFEELEVSLAESPANRLTKLPHLAFTAERAGALDKARSYAAEALSGDGGNRPVNLYYGNHVLGLLALHEGNVALAKQHLLMSATTPGWRLMAEFGPNMTLAKRLLERGESEGVLEFLERCKSIWKNGIKNLAVWQAIIRAGGSPDFGNNLSVSP